MKIINAKEENIRRSIFPSITGQRQTLTLDDPHTFHCGNLLVFEEIPICLGVFHDPMFLWIYSNSCQLNLLLVRSHQAEIIIAKRLAQGRNSVTRVRVGPKSGDRGRRKNDS